MFVTTNTKDREKVFSDPAFARMAVETLYETQQKYSFFLYAFVIMPDHCHLLMSVPEGGSVSKIMYSYKRSVSFIIGKRVWQSRFHIKMIDSVSGAIAYIHQNPVKAGLCEHVEKYPWSSASGK